MAKARSPAREKAYEIYKDCIYYVKSFNATQSAIKAGYAADSAHVEGSRLIRNEKGC